MNSAGQVDDYITHLIDCALEENCETESKTEEDGLSPWTGILNEPSASSANSILHVSQSQNPVLIQRHFGDNDPFCLSNAVHGIEVNFELDNSVNFITEGNQEFCRQYLPQHEDQDKAIASKVELQKLQENDYFHNFMKFSKQKKPTGNDCIKKFCTPTEVDKKTTFSSEREQDLVRMVKVNTKYGKSVNVTNKGNPGAKGKLGSKGKHQSWTKYLPKPEQEPSEEEKVLASKVELKKIQENEYFHNFMSISKQKKATGMDHTRKFCGPTENKITAFSSETEEVNPLQALIANIIEGLDPEEGPAETSESSADVFSNADCIKDTDESLICGGCGLVYTSAAELDHHVTSEHSLTEMSDTAHTQEREYLRLSEELQTLQRQKEKERISAFKEQGRLYKMATLNRSLGNTWLDSVKDTNNESAKTSPIPNDETVSLQRTRQNSKYQRSRQGRGRNTSRGSSGRSTRRTNQTDDKSATMDVHSKVDKGKITEMEEEKESPDSSDDDVILIEPKIELIVLDSEDGDVDEEVTASDYTKLKESDQSTEKEPDGPTVNESMLLKQFGIKNASVKLNRINPTLKLNDDKKPASKGLSENRNVSCNVKVDNVESAVTKLDKIALSEDSSKDRNMLCSVRLERVKPTMIKHADLEPSKETKITLKEIKNIPIVEKLDRGIKRPKDEKVTTINAMSSDQLLMKKYGIKDISINILKTPVRVLHKDKTLDRSSTGSSCKSINIPSPEKVTRSSSERMHKNDVKHRVTRSRGLPSMGNDCFISDNAEEHITLTEASDLYIGYDDSISGISSRSFNSVRTDDQMSVLSSGSVSPQPSTSSGFIYIPPKRTARKSVKDEALKKQYLLKEPRVLLKSMSSIELALLKNPHSHFGKSDMLQNDVDSDECQEQNVPLKSLLDDVEDIEELNRNENDSKKGKGKALSKHSKSQAMCKRTVDTTKDNSKSYDAGLLKKFGITRSIVVIQPRKIDDNKKGGTKDVSTLNATAQDVSPHKHSSQSDGDTNSTDRKSELRRNLRSSPDKCNTKSNDFVPSDPTALLTHTTQTTAVGGRCTRSKQSTRMKTENRIKQNVSNTSPSKVVSNSQQMMDICKPFSIALTSIGTLEKEPSSTKTLQANNTRKRTVLTSNDIDGSANLSSCNTNINLETRHDRSSKHDDNDVKPDVLINDDTAGDRGSGVLHVEKVVEDVVEGKLDTIDSDLGFISHEDEETISDKGNMSNSSVCNDGQDIMKTLDENTKTKAKVTEIISFDSPEDKSDNMDVDYVDEPVIRETNVEDVNAVTNENDTKRSTIDLNLECSDNSDTFKQQVTLKRSSKESVNSGPSSIKRRKLPNKNSSDVHTACVKSSQSNTESFTSGTQNVTIESGPITEIDSDNKSVGIHTSLESQQLDVSVGDVGSMMNSHNQGHNTDDTKHVIINTQKTDPLLDNHSVNTESNDHALIIDKTQKVHPNQAKISVRKRTRSTEKNIDVFDCAKNADHEERSVEKLTEKNPDNKINDNDGKICRRGEVMQTDVIETLNDESSELINSDCVSHDNVDFMNEEKIVETGMSQSDDLSLVPLNSINIIDMSSDAIIGDVCIHKNTCN